VTPVSPGIGSDGYGSASFEEDAGTGAAAALPAGGVDMSGAEEEDALQFDEFDGEDLDDVAEAELDDMEAGGTQQAAPGRGEEAGGAEGDATGEDVSFGDDDLDDMY